MKPLRIFLGDLTYDTISLSTESFPLNIGYIASYCIEKFGSSIDITLFKHINELDKAIHDSPPDILHWMDLHQCNKKTHEPTCIGLFN